MEHRYDDLLTKIIRTVKNDYVGFPQKQERHDSRYYVNTTGTAFKQGVLDELLFLRIVSQYLASLGDPNLKFSMVDHEDYQNYTVGFRVRRYEKDLYVTECTQDQRLQVGDRILSINQLPAGDHREKFRKNIVIGNTAEREQWGGFLKMADHFVVEHVDGSTEDLPFKHFPVEQPQRRMEFRALASDTGYLCIEEFPADTSALVTILSEHEAELRACTNLILDLRKNESGTESGFVPLLPLVLDRPMSLSEAMADEPIETNYTKENCDRRITEFRAIREMCVREGNETAARMCDDLIREFRGKSGSGLCREAEELEALSGQERPFEQNTLSEQVEDAKETDISEMVFETADGEQLPGEASSASASETALLQPYANIEKIILLTDTWCRDAGEVFVKLAAKSSKVTVLGRPTMGTIDYTNSVAMLLDQTFVLSYPMSRRGHVADGICYNDTGLPVDVYVPWTPQECTQDVLLAKALETL